jgi:hypothetical protein
MIIASVVALSLLTLLSVFQLALVFGAPLGHFAWGGKHKVLPKNLRIGSIVSILLYVGFAILIISKAGFWEIVTNETVISVGLWSITSYLALGILLNAVSRSKPERYTMTPVVLVLTVCFFIIASA